MVWFQCEDCGENLKKPKLPNHFRICSAGKLSCIDCGTIFDKKSVQTHTQCVSEAEKYGPKGVACVKEAVKPNKQEHNQHDLDMNTGLSIRPPWSCSLCNVKATSQETLLLHSQGKKHWSKVRATSSKLQPDSGNKVLSDVAEKMASSNDGKEFRSQSPQAINNQSLPPLEPPALLSQEQCNQKTTDAFSVPDNVLLNSEVEEMGKRKHKRKMVDDIMKYDDMKKRCTGRRENGSYDQNDTCIEQEKSEQVLSKNSTYSKSKKCSSSANCFESEKQESNGKHADDFEELPHYSSSCSLKEQKQLQENNAALGKGSKGQQLPEGWSKSVKWKKLIKRALVNAPDSSMKLKKLCKSLLPVAMQAIETAGVSADEAALLMEINNQVRSYKKLAIEGKQVRLQV